jgi:hypothetical protein
MNTKTRMKELGKEPRDNAWKNELHVAGQHIDELLHRIEEVAAKGALEYVWQLTEVELTYSNAMCTLLRGNPHNFEVEGTYRIEPRWVRIRWDR